MVFLNCEYESRNMFLHLLQIFFHYSLDWQTHPVKPPHGETNPTNLQSENGRWQPRSLEFLNRRFWYETNQNRMLDNPKKHQVIITWLNQRGDQRQNDSKKVRLAMDCNLLSTDWSIANSDRINFKMVNYIAAK